MSVQSVYLALFGRPADPGGLAYWNEVTNGGKDLSVMLKVLPGLAEYTTRFEGMDNTQVVTTIYKNLFGREPDAEGLAFFEKSLADGTQTIATIAVNILDGASGEDLADIEAKEEAANLFTESLDTPEEIAAYNGDVAAQGARAFLDNVDAENPATPESVQNAVEAVEAGDPNGGQEPDEEEPVDPGPGPGPGDPGPSYTNSYGNLEATFADNELYAGGGNPANGFLISRNAAAGIELGLDLRFDQNPAEFAPTDMESATWVVPVDQADALRFAYSVSGIDLDAYDYRLTLTDITGDAEYVMTLGVDDGENPHENNADSAYDWYYNGEPLIEDDGGNSDVSQNVQKLDWLATNYTAGHEYTVKLEAFVKDTTTVIASTEANIEYSSAEVPVIDFDGSNAAQVATTSVDGVDGIYWIRDRKLPGEFKLDDGAIAIVIDPTGSKATDESPGRAVPYDSYQGMKLRDGTPTTSWLDITINDSKAASISFDFFIDPTWDGDETMQAVSFWPFAADESGQTFYPIIDYVDADSSEFLAGRWNADDDTIAGQSGFRIWDSSSTGAWGNFVPTEELSGWVSLHLLVEHDKTTWTVSQGDEIIATFSQEGVATELDTFAFQGLNFGIAEEYMIDNLKISEVVDIWA